MEKLYSFTFILTFLTQFFFGYALFYFSNYGITALDLNVLICYFLLLFAFFVYKKPLEISINYSNILLFVFIIWSAIPFILPLIGGKHNEVVQGIKSLSHFYYVVFFIVLLYLGYIKPKTYIIIIKILIWLLLILNLYGIYQLFARAFDLPLAWVSYTNRALLSRYEVIGEVYQAATSYGSFFRATSIFTEPSALASWNIYLFLFLAIPWIQYREGFIKNNKLLIFLVIINLITLFLTYSLTGLAGFLAMFCLVFVLEKYKSYKFLFSIGIIAIICVLLTNFFLTEVLNIDLLKLFSYRVENIFSLGQDEMGGESFSGRLENAISTIKVWQTSPLIGIGLGLTGYQKEFVALFSDTTILSVLADTGIIGFIVFNALLYSLIFTSIKLYKKLRNNESLPLEERKLIGVAPYITFFEIVRCTFTANILIYFILWMNLSLAFFVINYYRNYLGQHTLVISLKK